MCGVNAVIYKYVECLTGLPFRPVMGGGFFPECMGNIKETVRKLAKVLKL